MTYIGDLLKDLVPFTIKLLMVFIAAVILVSVGSNIFFSNSRVGGSAKEMVASGTAKRKVTPDSATITLGKIIRGSNIAELQTKGAEAINQLTTKLKAAGVDEKNIKTSNYNVNPTYNTNGDVKDYEIRISVQVTMEKVNPQNELLGKVIQAGSDSGVNEVYGLNFYLADADKVARELEEEAIADAKSVAEKRAKAIGANLGKAIRVDVGNSGGGPIPMYDRAETMAADAKTLTFSAGQFDLETTVTVVYELN